MNDTRDAERVQTQAVGRALGLLGYASGSSLEGDTDEPDAAEHLGGEMVPSAKAKGELMGALAGDQARAKDAWTFGASRFVSRDDLDELLEQVKGSPVPMAGEDAELEEGSRRPSPDVELAPSVPPDAGDDASTAEPGSSPVEGVAAAREALKGKK